MRPFPTDPAGLSLEKRLFRALASFADEVCATTARLFAYMGALALIGSLTLYGWKRLALFEPAEAAPLGHWNVADRMSPSFAAGLADGAAKEVGYLVLRHPDGGRRDIMRWSRPDGRPAAELEVYRRGGEFDPASDPLQVLAARMPPATPLDAAGLVQSKFGPVALHGGTALRGGPACLGFIKRIEDPALQISGFSCQGETAQARRAAIACMLDRLTMLNSGNEPRLAGFFARAELKRGHCNITGPAWAPESGDWVTRTEEPRLRGSR